MRPLLRLIVLSTLGLSGMVAMAQAVPRLMNYQGKLVNASNTPLATADYPLRFSIYNVEAGGSPVWGPQVFDGLATTGHGPLIPVVQGHFNVILGPVDTAGRSILTAFTNGQYAYLEITISNNLTIQPRQQVLSAPYALKSADAELLGGYGWNAFFSGGNPASGTISGSRITTGTVGSDQIANYSISAIDLADNSVTSAKILNGSIMSSDLDTSSVTSEKILDFTITTSDLANSSVNSDKIANYSITTDDLSSSVSRALVPPGAIMPYGGISPPLGWLLCDGRTWSRTGYNSLYQAIGTRWGNGDGSTTFNVPDLRGMFLRGYNSTRTGTFADPDSNSRVASGTGGSVGNSVGSAQTDQFASHTHTETRYLDSGRDVDRATATGDDVGSLQTVATGSAGGAETRPNNVYVQFIIKY